jgi:7-carboxy-7-deazaguanine synthase
MPVTKNTEFLPEADQDQGVLTINEIYESIQGESSWAGERCIFVRLTFCNLRCSYCDTEYAFYEGKKRGVSEIFDEVIAIDCPMVEITGGEPLLQKGVLGLMEKLCDAGRRVLIETSGNRDISVVDPRVHVIMDLKTPSSGEQMKNRLENIPHLAKKDEVKFVIGSEEDYQWSKGMVLEHGLNEKCEAVLFSPVFGKINARDIVDWIVRDKLDVRFQLQMHKFIWEPTKKGV